MNKREQGGIRDFRVGDHERRPLTKENKYAQRTAGWDEK